MDAKRGLEPIIDANSHTLILGTLPGDESLRTGQYYANPANQFWRILEGVYAEPVGSTYASRVAFLRARGLALWDLLRSAQRVGSSDANIKRCLANDFEHLFATHRAIKAVVLSGTKCATEWRRLRLSTDGIRVECVPSTSPTPGRHVLSLEEKIVAWRKALRGA